MTVAVCAFRGGIVMKSKGVLRLLVLSFTKFAMERV